MKFEEGHSKIGGRSKGTKNKKTLLLESFAKTIVEDGMEKFQEELMKLRGKSFITAYLDLLEYVKPKLQRSSIDINWDCLNDQQIDELYDRILNSINNSKRDNDEG